MENILTNYTNKERALFMENAIYNGKRIEKYGNTLYALAENEIVENGEIVKDEERVARLQREEFERQFFNTSLGYVRRLVHNVDGSVDKFLTDILPLLEVDTPIITYNANGTQNTNVKVTEGFIQECKRQKLADFYGV